MLPDPLQSAKNSNWVWHDWWQICYNVSQTYRQNYLLNFELIFSVSWTTVHPRYLFAMIASTRSTQNESPITQNPQKIAEYWKTWEENSVSFHFVPLSQVRQPGQPPSPYTGWPPARKCGEAWRGEEPFTDPIWENYWKARIAIARKEQKKTVSTSAKQQRKKRIRNFNNPSLIILIRF